jgi:hypothetical protein
LCHATSFRPRRDILPLLGGGMCERCRCA